jgi:hypothetical protein
VVAGVDHMSADTLSGLSEDTISASEGESLFVSPSRGRTLSVYIGRPRVRPSVYAGSVNQVADTCLPAGIAIKA